MQINKAYQTFLSEGQSRGNLAFLTFLPKPGWRLSKDEAGAESQLHTGRLMLDPESLSVGFKIFTCNDDGDFVGAVSEYASGGDPVVKKADLPEMTHKDFAGNIHTDKKGWKRSARIQGVLARKIGATTEYIRVMYDADRGSALQDLARLLAVCQEKVDSKSDAYPVVTLGARSYSFTNKNGTTVNTRAPELKPLSWLAQAAYQGALAKTEAPAEAKPAPAEDNPPAPPIDEVMAMANEMDEEEPML